MGLFLRSLFWTILFPGTVTVLVPSLFFAPPASAFYPAGRYGWAGLLLIVPGAAILLWSIVDFAGKGKGTLSPADPARFLVAGGLYRYVRNPMYLGVLSILLGEALWWHSMPLLGYALAIFVLFHSFVSLYEEPYLRRRFGASYDAYCKNVGRWLPRFRS